MTKLPFVIVEWNDAWVDGTEPIILSEVANSHKPKVIRTAGWLLRQDDVGVSLANEYYADEDIYRGRTFIFAPMVISVTPHNLTKPRRPRSPTPEVKT